MANIIGRGVKIEVGKTEGAPIAITTVSQGKPGVATKVAHGLNDKSVGYFIGVAGMAQLEGQAVRVAEKTADTFKLESLNTTSFPAYTDGDFIPITAWATLSEATSYQIPDGTADKLDGTTLLDDIKQEVNGLLNAQTVSIAVNAQARPGEAAALIEDAAQDSTYLVFRITLKTGETRVFRGQPSLPGENVAKGAIGTGSINVTVKGVALKGAA